MPFKYPRISCKNTDCPNKLFTPKRSDQLYCDHICKDYSNNLLKRIKNKTAFKREKTLRNNANSLEEIYNNPLYPDKTIPELILLHEKIDVLTFTDMSTDKKTGRKIIWSHNYGIELINTSPPKNYKVHSR